MNKICFLEKRILSAKIPFAKLNSREISSYILVNWFSNNFSLSFSWSGMVKTVIIAWVIWFIYVFIMVTAVPEVVYKPTKNLTATSLMLFLIGGHVLTFFAIRINTRKIVSATHNSQQTRLFQREKKAFMDMTLYTIATLLSIFPVLLLENANLNVISRNILLPWAATFAFLVSSFNPVIQILRNATLRQALKTAIRG